MDHKSRDQGHQLQIAGQQSHFRNDALRALRRPQVSSSLEFC